MKLLYERCYHNDIWLAAFVEDGVLINDGYDGLCVISENLQEIRKKIRFKECIFLREKYIKDNGEEILIYLDDNAGFIYVDLNALKTIYINIPKKMENVALSDKFIWYGNKIYIRDYGCKCCIVDVNTQSVSYNRIEGAGDVRIPQYSNEILSTDMEKEYHNDYYFNGVWIMMSEKIMDIVVDNKYRLNSMGEFICVDVKKKNDNYYVAVLDDIYGNDACCRKISIYEI